MTIRQNIIKSLITNVVRLIDRAQGSKGAHFDVASRGARDVQAPVSVYYQGHLVYLPGRQTSVGPFQGRAAAFVRFYPRMYARSSWSGRPIGIGRGAVPMKMK